VNRLIALVQVGKVKVCGTVNNWKFGNRVGDLFNAMRRHQLVHWFDLQGCMLESERVRKGLEMLQTVKSLETFDLQDNAIDRSCLPAIVEFLRASNVKHLYLQGNRLNKWDFDELESVVSKLGRECTVYCYKDKDQPMRKLICSTIRQVDAMDDSLSFSTAHLNNIFQKYKDRRAVSNEALLTEEIVYSHNSRKISEPVQPLPCAVSDAVEADQAVAADVSIGDCTVSHDVCAPEGPCQEVPPRMDLPDLPLVHSRAHMQPCPSEAMPSHPAPALTPIDSMVAMGFEREAAVNAYAKSGCDLQVCLHVFLFCILVFTRFPQRAVDILITEASISQPLTSSSHQKKAAKIKTFTNDSKSNSSREAPAQLQNATRHRRIQESDDDDELPVSRSASAAVLPAPEPKSAQKLSVEDDDEIILMRLTQSAPRDAVDLSAAPSPTGFLDPTTSSLSSTTAAQNRSVVHSNQDDQDDAPIARCVQPALAAADPQSLAAPPAPAARPKLKGLGSLVRRHVPSIWN
jgi:hypothetical protein